MRAIRKYFFPLLLSLTIFLSTGISTNAMGDGNIDGGGGSFGTGSELNVWRNNQDGVRVTVVTTGGSVVATPIDLSNCSIASTVLNFGKVSKLQYTGLITFHKCLLHLLKTSCRSTKNHQRICEQS